jgi:hypothetical protein
MKFLNVWIPRIIKICDLIFLSMLLFCSALCISVMLNFSVRHLFSAEITTINSIYVEEATGAVLKKPLIPITSSFIIEMVFRIAGITVLCYIFRSFIQQIPFPLDGFFGYRHRKLRELYSISLLTTLTFFFQNKLKNDASYIGDNFWQLMFLPSKSNHQK